MTLNAAELCGQSSNTMTDRPGAAPAEYFTRTVRIDRLFQALDPSRVAGNLVGHSIRELLLLP
jgi:hypothetical protein